MLASVWFVALPSISFGALGVLAPLRLHDLGLGAVAISGVWLVAVGVRGDGGAARRHDLGPARAPLAAARSAPPQRGSASSLFTVLDAHWGAFAAGIVACSFALGAFWAPAMSLASDEAEALGLDYAFGFAIINLAWAPAQVAGSAGGGALADATSDAVAYLVLAALFALTLARAVEIRKLLVANRGEIALRIFRTCRALGIGTVAVVGARRPRLAARAHGGRDGRDRGVPPLRGAHPRGEGRRAPTRSIPATASSPRARTSPRRSTPPGSCGSARRRTRCAPAATSSRRSGSRAEAGVPVVETGEPEELGFPLMLKAAAGGGGRGMRVVRSRDELADALEAARREAKAAFGDDRVFAERYVERPRHVEIQLLGDDARQRRRARRARVLDPAAAPEGARGVAVARARPVAARGDERRGGPLRARDRLHERRHGRVHARRPRLLLPRAERPHPGRASGHGARDRASTSSRSSCASRPDRRMSRVTGLGTWPRGRGAPVRRGSAHVPAAGRPHHAARPAGVGPRRRRRRGGRRDRARVRPDDREADRARADARRRVRPARGGARRDRRRRRDDEPAVPALARRAPGRARRPHDDGVPHRAPAALAAAASDADARAWRGAWRLNLPAPPPAPPPDLDSAAHDRHRRARRERRHRADARHRDQGARRAGRPGASARSRCSSSRR